MASKQENSGKSKALAHANISEVQDASAIDPFPEHDYEAIEAAVMETARGRWFLSEYAARNRTSNTNEILGAISELHTKFEGLNSHKSEKTAETEINTPENNAIIVDAALLQINIAEITQMLEMCKQAIEAISSAQFSLQSIDQYKNKYNYLNDLVNSLNNKILQHVEKIQEISYDLEENGEAQVFCRSIQDLATDVFIEYAHYDKVLNTIKTMGEALTYIEKSINIISLIQSQNATMADNHFVPNEDIIALEPFNIEDILPPQNENSATDDLFARVSQELSQLNIVPEGVFAQIQKTPPAQQVPKSKKRSLTETLTDVLKIVEKDENTKQSLEIIDEIKPCKFENKKNAVIQPIDIEYHALSFSEKYALFG